MSNASITSDSCSVAGPLQNLGHLSTRMYIFTSMAFSCDGVITEWEFYAKNTGTFYVAIWRPDGSDYTLVSSNKIVVTTVGHQV